MNQYVHRDEKGAWPIPLDQRRDMGMTLQVDRPKSSCCRFCSAVWVGLCYQLGGDILSVLSAFISLPADNNTDHSAFCNASQDILPQLDWLVPGSTTQECRAEWPTGEIGIYAYFISS